MFDLAFSNQHLHRHSGQQKHSRAPFIICSNSYWTCMESYKTTKLSTANVKLRTKNYHTAQCVQLDPIDDGHTVYYT